VAVAVALLPLAGLVRLAVMVAQAQHHLSLARL
jgi:hypothetical protein